MMSQTLASNPTLKAPRAAAVAGVLFSVLMLIGLGVVRIAVPPNPVEPGTWANDPARQHVVEYALQLVPIAGITFLWLMGVLRERLGALEDRFFATVFLGSGLLFVGSLFASAATATALVQMKAAGNINLTNS